ncbi:putative ADP-ribosyltransferase Certhrax [Ruminococcus bromii]|nr:phage minor capsid protein [Ruminococcus bromii]PKD27963.1 putative ADP-ribosyltransferase Certhrax [Ruminococcus bromii]SPE90975.1 Putative ADP-ribosyltransferase Certhrax,Phage minor capsid protein 2 [Ruminococcus bromii L2-63]
MFTPTEIEALPSAMEQLYRSLQLNIMSDLTERLKANGEEITSAADWQINRLYELGVSKDEIDSLIQSTLDVSDDEIDRIYDEVVKSGYARNEELYTSKGKEYIPYAENKQLQQLVKAVKNQTKSEYRNITGSLGFAVRNADNTLSFTLLADFYQRTLGNGLMQIASGAVDYNTVLKRAVKTMTDSGLRTVDYASGWSNRVDVAARRALMTGFNQVVTKVNEDNAEQLGTEYFEVSYHRGARPTHQVWQGRVYSKKELETVCGLGTVTGLCGANCYHSYSPFIKGIDTPTYSEEELDRMNEEENTPKEYNGRQYTAYEAQQRQRRLETAMRADRQKIELLTQGGADDDTITGAKVRYFQRQDEYVKFSKAMNLPQQWERITVDGKNALGSKLPKKAERFDRRAEYSLDGDNKRIAQTRADEWHDKAKKAKKKSKKIDTGTSQKSDVQKKTVEKAENNDIIKETKQLSLSNVEEFENWQNDYYELNKDVSFSRDDNPSIYRYTGGDYDIINALERGGESLEKVKKRYGEKYVSSLNGVGDEISKELSKFKLNEPLKLKRSVGNVDFITNATSSVEDMRKMIGKKFTEKGFTSTTLCSDTQLAFGGIDKPTRTTLEIIAPKETKGAYLYKISDSPAEFEFLIDKNTTYEVVDAGEREITVKDYKGNYEKKTERFMTLKVVEQ